MIRTPRRRGHGKSIELDKDLGVTEGRQVKSRVNLIEPLKPTPTPISDELVEDCAILGELER